MNLEGMESEEVVSEGRGSVGAEVVEVVFEGLSGIAWERSRRASMRKWTNGMRFWGRQRRKMGRRKIKRKQTKDKRKEG